MKASKKKTNPPPDGFVNDSSNDQSTETAIGQIGGRRENHLRHHGILLLGHGHSLIMEFRVRLVRIFLQFFV